MVEIAYYFLTMLFLSPYVYIHLQEDNEIPEFVITGQNWVFGIMAVFLGWLELVLYLRSYMFPTLGLYITMFFEILKTFTRVFSVILLFLLGYATVFYIIFPQQVGVNSLQTLRTIKLWHMHNAALLSPPSAAYLTHVWLRSTGISLKMSRMRSWQ